MHSVRWTQVAISIIGLVFLFWTAIRPSKSDRLRWYDRGLRALGVFLILGVLIYGLYLHS